MKGFVTVILFFLFALAFAGTEYVDAVPAASMTVCTVQHTDTTPQHSINEDRVIPLDSNKGIADMEFGDGSYFSTSRQCLCRAYVPFFLHGDYPIYQNFVA